MAGITQITAKEIAVQHPAESKLYGFDFSDLMKVEGEHLWSAHLPAISINQPGLVISEQSIDTPLAKARIANVAADVDYEITVTCISTLDDTVIFNTHTMVCRLRGRSK